MSKVNRTIEEYLEKYKEVGEAKSLLKLALEDFSPRIAIASSFSNEDIVLIDILSKVSKELFSSRDSFKIFSLDTGRLNTETYNVAEEVSKMYSIKIHWYFPQTKKVEELITSKGLFSFKDSLENRKECCSIRKIEPLKRALSTVDAWITGQRKEQSITRESLALAQEDSANGILKFNPLANWDYKQVESYIVENKLPYNKLYDLGYQSIGCAPCTRATKKTEDVRAGRWWWENPEHKECGLHLD